MSNNIFHFSINIIELVFQPMHFFACFYFFLRVCPKIGSNTHFDIFFLKISWLYSEKLFSSFYNHKNRYGLRDSLFCDQKRHQKQKKIIQIEGKDFRSKNSSTQVHGAHLFIQFFSRYYCFYRKLCCFFYNKNKHACKFNAFPIVIEIGGMSENSEFRFEKSHN